MMEAAEAWVAAGAGEEVAVRVAAAEVCISVPSL